MRIYKMLLQIIHGHAIVLCSQAKQVNEHKLNVPNLKF